MLQRRLIDEIVMRVVADLVEREIEIRRAKIARGLVESFDMNQTAEGPRQRLRIIRNARGGRRQGREERHAHDTA